MNFFRFKVIIKDVELMTGPEFRSLDEAINYANSYFLTARKLEFCKYEIVVFNTNIKKAINIYSYSDGKWVLQSKDDTFIHLMKEALLEIDQNFDVDTEIAKSSCRSGIDSARGLDGSSPIESDEKKSLSDEEILKLKNKFLKQ